MEDEASDPFMPSWDHPFWTFGKKSTTVVAFIYSHGDGSTGDWGTMWLFYLLKQMTELSDVEFAGGRARTFPFGNGGAESKT